MSETYFLYSKEQLEKRKSGLKKIGKTIKPGTVMVQGKWRTYSEISNSASSQYSDMIVVAKGDLSDMSYNDPVIE